MGTETRDGGIHIPVDQLISIESKILLDLYNGH